MDDSCGHYGEKLGLLHLDDIEGLIAALLVALALRLLRQVQHLFNSEYDRARRKHRNHSVWVAGAQLANRALKN